MLGVGLGSDRFGQRVLRGPARRSTTGCAAEMLDESLGMLDRRLVRRAGAPSRRALHRRRPAVPPAPGRSGPDPGVGGRLPGTPRPLRRAARLDGFFPVNLEHPRPARRGGRRDHRAARPRPARRSPYDVAVAAARRAPTPTPYAAGRRHLVARRVRPGEAVTVDRCAACCARGRSMRTGERIVEATGSRCASRPLATRRIRRSCSSTARARRCCGGTASCASGSPRGGRYVIRYDNRDTGRSTSAIRPGEPGYTLARPGR